MRVLVTGATGFIGRALVLRLQREGHEVSALVRSPQRARDQLGAEVELVPTGGLRQAVAEADGVVNLAGEPIVGKRWTEERKRALTSSRVELTRSLVSALGEAPEKRRVLVSASAVGYYGDRGDEVLTESSGPGSDFLARLCQEWEGAAAAASSLGVRVVTPRIGIVLGREGGALASMLPAFRLGLGGPFGSGRQYMPWIHLEDLTEILATALIDERFRGPLNAVGPAPVLGSDFAKALGRALRRPAALPVPALGLRALFGEASNALLASQRAVPARLEDLGFWHRFPTLEGALGDVVMAPEIEIFRLAPSSPAPEADGSSYLARNPPRYLLRATTVLEAPLAQSFDFFSRPANLGLITPAGMGFRIKGAAPTMVKGAGIEYDLEVAGKKLRWRTRIERWEPGRLFIDSQESGPYRCWWHEHHFRADGHRTVMEDRVFYTPPAGPIGMAVNVAFVAPTLRRIFGFRRAAIRARFGEPATAPPPAPAPVRPEDSLHASP